MTRELGELLAAARSGELDVTDFAERLDSLHTRFLGDAAATPEMVEHRRRAVRAYQNLVAGIDMDRHHHLELLAEALNADPPNAPDNS